MHIPQPSESQRGIKAVTRPIVVILTEHWSNCDQEGSCPRARLSLHFESWPLRVPQNVGARCAIFVSSGRPAYALECPPRKQNKDAKLFCCHTEGLRSTPSLSLTYPKVLKHHILVIQALSLKYTLKNISLSICVIIFELCKSILPWFFHCKVRKHTLSYAC